MDVNVTILEYSGSEFKGDVQWSEHTHSEDKSSFYFYLTQNQLTI